MSENLLLVSGLLCSDDLWLDQIGAFEQDFNIMLVDHQSHDCIKDMVTAMLLDAPETFSLAGLSLGGYVAFEVMRQAPERVEKLILLDTNARADNEAQKIQRQQMIEQDANQTMVSLIQTRMHFLVHPDHLSDQNLCQRIEHMAEETGMAAYIRQQKAMLTRPDSRDGLKNINGPTLIICGDKDALTPPKVHQEMADLIAGAEFHIIKNCGHLSSMEKPDEVNRLMTDFLG